MLVFILQESVRLEGSLFPSYPLTSACSMALVLGFCARELGVSG